MPKKGKKPIVKKLRKVGTPPPPSSFRKRKIPYIKLRLSSSNPKKKYIDIKKEFGITEQIKIQATKIKELPKGIKPKSITSYKKIPLDKDIYVKPFTLRQLKIVDIKTLKERTIWWQLHDGLQGQKKYNEVTIIYDPHKRPWGVVDPILKEVITQAEKLDFDERLKAYRASRLDYKPQLRVETPSKLNWRDLKKWDVNTRMQIYTDWMRDFLSTVAELYPEMKVWGSGKTGKLGVSTKTLAKSVLPLYHINFFKMFLQGRKGFQESLDKNEIFDLIKAVIEGKLRMGTKKMEDILNELGVKRGEIIKKKKKNEVEQDTFEEENETDEKTP